MSDKLLDEALAALSEMRAKLAAVREVVDEHGCDCVCNCGASGCDPCFYCQLKKALGDD